MKLTFTYENAHARESHREAEKLLLILFLVVCRTFDLSTLFFTVYLLCFNLNTLLCTSTKPVPLTSVFASAIGLFLTPRTAGQILEYLHLIDDKIESKRSHQSFEVDAKDLLQFCW